MKNNFYGFVCVLLDVKTEIPGRPSTSIFCHHLVYCFDVCVLGKHLNIVSDSSY